MAACIAEIANMDELIMLVSEYQGPYNMGLASYKDNLKKNWAWDNVSTNPGMTGISPEYVEIFGNVSYRPATVGRSLCLVYTHNRTFKIFTQPLF